MLEALLWAFHNARSGLCFPSYETIAEAAHCARSTVAEAIKALEDAGILSWVQRIKRVREHARSRISREALRRTSSSGFPFALISSIVSSQPARRATQAL
jgi:DNA-binding transcriptional regulator YhcF (GntR family)